jgi:uncharacterized membrane protein YuzA (DUF378 family)
MADDRRVDEQPLLVTTTIVRLVALILGASVCGLSLVALRHRVDLVNTQPDGSMGSRINQLAYAAVGIAGAQAVAQQIVFLRADRPLNWYGAPIIIVWQGMMIVWFVRRVEWHVRATKNPDRGVSP